MKKKELPKWGWQDEDHIAVLWNVYDVKTQASIRNIKLTKEECRQVLDACLHRHDANIGISWDILDHHIWDLFGHRKKVA